MDGALNFRDLGGGVTTDGQPLATGRLFRAATLDSLSDDGLATIEQLGIRTVIDLRSQRELDHAGTFPHDRVPVAWHHVSSRFGPPTGGDDGRMRQIMESDDPMAGMFKLMITEGTDLFAGALRIISEPDATPVVFHCTTGKDRTGLLALMIQLVAGLDLEEALVDFEYSAEAIRDISQSFMARFPGIEQMPQAMRDHMRGADRSWVFGAFDEIGGLEQLPPWLDSLGIDAARRATLRAHLLDS